MIRSVRAQILQQAEQRPEAAPTIFINENVSLPFAIKFPSERAVKQTIKRRRRRLTHTNPATELDNKIKIDCANTMDVEPFLLVNQINIENKKIKLK